MITATKIQIVMIEVQIAFDLFILYVIFSSSNEDIFVSSIEQEFCDTPSTCKAKKERNELLLKEMSYQSWFYKCVTKYTVYLF